MATFKPWITNGQKDTELLDIQQFLDSEDYSFHENNSFQSITNSTLLETSLDSKFHVDFSLPVLVLISVFFIIIGLTTVGNVLVCLSVVLVRKLRKPQNYLLVSLALSDLFVALFVMPFAIVFEVHQGLWPLNEGFCDFWVSADVLCCTASILNLCAISLDRHRAITAPLEYTAKTTPRRMLGIIFVVWLLSACVSLPPVLLLGNVHEHTNGNPFCSVSQDFWYQIYATMASFYVPLSVMLFVYFKILRVVAEKKKQMTWKEPRQSINRTSVSSATNTLNILSSQLQTGSPQSLIHNGSKKDSLASNHSHYGGRCSGTPLLMPQIGRRHSLVATLNSSNVETNVVAGNSNNSDGKAQSGLHFFPTTTLRRLKKDKPFGGLKEHKASTVLGIIMTAFIVCWLPFFILAIMRPFLSIQGIFIPDWISSLFTWLGWANSALNPLIYATLNRDFRRPFKEILCFRCSTLDSLMKREFYQEQYGEDSENIARKMSRANIHVAIASPKITMKDENEKMVDPVCV